MRLSELLEYVRVNPQLTVDGDSYYNIVMPYLTSDPDLIERTFGVVIPSALRELWKSSATMAFCYEAQYRQWGMILWSTERVLLKQQDLKNLHPDEYLRGDLIIGEFLGDAELIVLRCDPESEDFGHVMVSLPMEPRSEWINGGPSLFDFIKGFIESPGKKFWE